MKDAKEEKLAPIEQKRVKADRSRPSSFVDSGNEASSEDSNDSSTADSNTMSSIPGKFSYQLFTLPFTYCLMTIFLLNIYCMLCKMVNLCVFSA